MNIKVLGSGCKSCHQLYDTVNEVINENNLNAKTEYVTDMSKLVEYAVMTIPALVIDEKVVSTGKVLSKKELLEVINGNLNDDQCKTTSCDCGGNC